jgi:RNA polymerase sigma-70 factor (ECF subfamily)
MRLIPAWVHRGFNSSQLFFLSPLKPFLPVAVSTPMPATTPRYPTPPSDATLRDADLAALVQAGRLHAAFEGILQRYESKVLHLCMALLRDRHAAEEVAQESFLRIWRALQSYNSETAALSTWVYAITRNRCLTELSRRPSALQFCDDGDGTIALQAAAESVPDTRALRLLRDLVETLPAPLRTSLTLYYFEEHSVEEVATMLGIPQGTVKTHLHRARSALHQKLKDRGLAHADLWL